MRIISKFHDYYDTAMGFGQDQSIVYVRETKVVPVEKDSEIHKEYKEGCSGRPWINQWMVNTDSFLVVVAGKVYPGVFCHYWNNHSSSKVITCYSPPDLENEELVKLLEERAKKFRSEGYASTAARAEKFLKHTYKDLTDVCIKLETPVFLIRRAKLGEKSDTGLMLEINPFLKPFEFYRRLSPFQAFQEISMFVSGVLPQNVKEPLQVEDKYRILGHGFDLKQSFRHRK